MFIEGTNSAGGYLVPDSVAPALISKINNESAIATFTPVTVTTSRRTQFPIWVNGGDADIVAEGSPKPVGTGSVGQMTVTAKKIAKILPFSDELIADAQEDPQALAGASIERDFAKAIDAHALGLKNGAAITSGFDVALSSTSSTVELGTGGAALADAISSAMAIIEGNGGTPNGVILASDLRGALRDAKRTVETADSVYSPGFGPIPTELWGVPLAYTSNLDALPAGAGKVAAIVGDFTHARLVVRTDIVVTKSNEATVVVDEDTTINAFQDNVTLLRWEMRVGFSAYDVNKQFVKITNAS